MKISIGHLRSIIKAIVIETTSGTTIPRTPAIKNITRPEFVNREQLSNISIKDAYEEDLEAPHLREPTYDKEDTDGPVPPTGDDPYMILDPYAT